MVRIGNTSGICAWQKILIFGSSKGPNYLQSMLSLREDSLLVLKFKRNKEIDQLLRNEHDL